MSKIFKKSIFVLFMFICTFSLVLSSCGKKDDPVTPTPDVNDGQGNTGGNGNTDGDGNNDGDGSTDSDDNQEVSKLEELTKKYNCKTLAEAIELAGTTKNVYTEEKYYICGEIVEMLNPQYGYLKISDGENTFEIYGSYNSDGTIKYAEMTDKPVVGDIVVYYGQLGFFNNPQIKTGWIMEYHHEEPQVDTDYVDMTINEAREADADKLVKVSGVVAQITYANGMVPNGFFLVDDTASIFVYGGNSASVVAVGNKVEVAGKKEYFISEKELANAEKFGYKGSCQLSEATVVTNDKKVNEFSTKGITESTIKDIVEAPFDGNNTTKIYKVNAYINKVPGSGFTNYYINDLDGKTGSYVYTACNGSDFEWLDQYDGKICTLYVSAINAKSSASGCIYRLLPIKVVSDSFEFDTTTTPDFVLKYHALGQFDELYKSNPSLEVVTSVSSEALGFENATVTYTSSDTNVIYFELVDGKMVMKTKNNGTATVTITVTYGDNTASGTVSIEVKNIDNMETKTVADAIALDDDKTITIKAFVLSSLVNRKGFYVMDETGVIAVLVDETTLEGIKRGHMLIITGTKEHFGKTENTAGETCLNNCVVEANLFGEHQAVTSVYDTTKTVEQLAELSVTEDYTNTVYSVSGTIVKVATPYSTNYYVANADGSVKIRLYAGSGSQYAWLDAYVGKDVSIAFALCNWNKKPEYTGCVVSVTLDGTTTYNELYIK